MKKNKTIIIIAGNNFNSKQIINDFLNNSEVEIKNIQQNEVKNIKDLFTIKENISENTDYYEFFRNKLNKYN